MSEDEHKDGVSETSSPDAHAALDEMIATQFKKWLRYVRDYGLLLINDTQQLTQPLQLILRRL